MLSASMSPPLFCGISLVSGAGAGFGWGAGRLGLGAGLGTAAGLLALGAGIGCVAGLLCSGAGVGAAAAGVLFAVLFGTALVLIRLALPEGEEPGAQWLETGSTNLKVAATIMPFAGIAFLWFMGVVRDGLGRYEDKFFSTVFIGSGLLFLAMMFVAAPVVDEGRGGRIVPDR